MRSRRAGLRNARPLNCGVGDGKACMLTYDSNAFSQRINEETDRACAVLAGALLDWRLNQLFRRRLHVLYDKLLDGTGPLATFAAKIQVARALAWISKETFEDLEVIRRIRNDFAHKFDHNLSFTDESISNRCRDLKVASSFLDGFDDALQDQSTKFGSVAIGGMKNAFMLPRWRFQLSVDFLAQHLDEIEDDSNAYAGPDLLAEVRRLSASMEIDISVMGTT